MKQSPRYNFRYPELTDQVSAFPPDVAAQNALLLDQVIGSLTDNLAGKANTVHQHTINQVTGLDTALSKKIDKQDTGWRNITGLFPNVVANQVVIRRHGVLCELVAEGLTFAPGTVESVIQLQGFRPVRGRYFSAFQNNQMSSSTFLQLIWDGRIVFRYSSPAALWVTATWTTNDPFPTTYPGVPS